MYFCQQKAFTQHQIVQKCALHWRQWAARHRTQHRPDHMTKPKLDHMTKPKLDHMTMPKVDALIRPIGVPHAQPTSEVVQSAVAPVKPTVSKAIVPGNLVPTISESPARSKGILPEPIPGKRVEFQLDR